MPDHVSGRLGVPLADSEQRRGWQWLLWVLILVIGAGYAYTAVTWYSLAPTIDIGFNATYFALAWTFLPGLLALFVSAVLLLRFWGPSPTHRSSWSSS